jgi:hypothetical protein
LLRSLARVSGSMNSLLVIANALGERAGWMIELS